MKKGEVELREYQKDGLRRIFQFNGRAVLGDEQGLGKTIQALAWINLLPRRRPAVIVCPSSVKYAWQAEAHAHFNMQMEVLEGFRPDHVTSLEGKIFVINYDILHSWLPALRAIKPEIVIFDEFQNIKNPEAKRSKAAKRLVKGAASRIGLSGTPFTNHLIELWFPLSIIKPGLFPHRLTFAWRYSRPKKIRGDWKFVGARRKKELRKILVKNVMIRRIKKDVAKELPNKIHKVIPFRLKSYNEYNEAKNHFIRWLKGKSLAKAHRAIKAQALVKIGYLLRLCAELKLEWTIKWLREFTESNPGKKVVALTMHTAVIDRLVKEFPNSVVVNGKVRGIKRQMAVKQFTNNGRIQFFFGNWKAAGVGLNLQASHIFVALDLPWTPGDLLQGQDRVHRIGQAHQVIIYYLMLMGTIEERLWEILRDRTEILTAVLNGEEGAVEFEEIFEALFKEFEK